MAWRFATLRGLRQDGVSQVAMWATMPFPTDLRLMWPQGLPQLAGSELGVHEGRRQEIFVEALLLLQHIGDLYKKPPRLGDHVGY